MTYSVCEWIASRIAALQCLRLHRLLQERHAGWRAITPPFQPLRCRLTRWAIGSVVVIPDRSTSKLDPGSCSGIETSVTTAPMLFVALEHLNRFGAVRGDQTNPVALGLELARLIDLATRGRGRRRREPVSGDGITPKYAAPLPARATGDFLPVSIPTS